MKKIKLQYWFSVVLIFLIFMGLSSTPIKAQQKIRGSVPRVITRLGLRPIGRLDSTKRLNLAICLPVRNKQSLENLFDQINNPNSPQFHKYRTHQEITELFGPTEEEYLALENFAKKTVLR